MRTRAIADTGLIIAYLSPRDLDHDWAVEQFERYPFFLTCEAVITEATHLARSPRPVVELLSRGLLRIAYQLDGDEVRVGALLKTYEDRPMDFADACLVRMSEQHEDCEIVTLDSDFLFYQRHGNRPIPVALP